MDRDQDAYFNFVQQDTKLGETEVRALLQQRKQDFSVENDKKYQKFVALYSKIDDEIYWALDCALWELVFMDGQTDGLCEDVYSDWPDDQQKYYCSQYHKKFNRLQSQWNMLPPNSKNKVINKCSAICGGKDNWWKAEDDQISKCAMAVYHALIMASVSI